MISVVANKVLLDLPVNQVMMDKMVRQDLMVTEATPAVMVIQVKTSSLIHHSAVVKLPEAHKVHQAHVAHLATQAMTAIQEKMVNQDNLDQVVRKADQVEMVVPETKDLEAIQETKPLAVQATPDHQADPVNLAHQDPQAILEQMVAQAETETRVHPATPQTAAEMEATVNQVNPVNQETPVQMDLATIAQLLVWLLAIKQSHQSDLNSIIS